MFYQRVDAKDLLDFTALPLSGDPAILCQDITVSRYVVFLHIKLKQVLLYYSLFLANKYL